MNQDPSAAMVRVAGLVETLRLLDSELIAAVRVARATGADGSELARLLGVHRSTLYRRYLTGFSAEVGDETDEV